MNKKILAAVAPLALASALVLASTANAATRGNYVPPGTTPPVVVVPPPPPPAATVVVVVPTPVFVAPAVQCGAGGNTSISRC